MYNCKVMTTNFKPCPRRAPLTRLRLWALSGMALLLAAAATAATQAEEVERCKTNTTFKESVVHFPVRHGLCVGCHKFENGKQPFTLRENIPKLCIGCHGMKMKDELGQPQPSIRSIFEAAGKPPEEGGLRLHKPFADGNCTCCHNPHTSSDRRMLDRPYPTTNYYDGFSPDRFMCFKCHNERAFTEPRTLDATRFRNGNLNLHYRHVNRDHKGRSCRLCHEHHASTYDALIRKEAPFGTKIIPITEFSRTENGGSCAPTCHIPVKYNRIEAELNGILTTPRVGEDALDADLWGARAAPPLKANYPPKKAAPKPDAPAGDAPKPDAPAGETPKTDAPAGAVI